MNFRRPVCASLGALVALVAASCSSGSESVATLPEITLITTTTDVVFETTDTDPTDPTDPASTPADTASDSAPDTTVSTTTLPPETTTTTTTTVAPTTTESPGEGRFSLSTDGLGSTSFGADPDGTIAFISSFLGQPTADTGWQDAFNFGACGGAELRQVSWGNLQLEFGDVSDITVGRRHFSAYSYGAEGSSTAVPSGLETAEGITVGSTVGALIATYPNVRLFQGDEFISDNFLISDNLSGRLSGLTDNDTVEMIIGGLPCEG